MMIHEEFCRKNKKANLKIVIFHTLSTISLSWQIEKIKNFNELLLALGSMIRVSILQI